MENEAKGRGARAGLICSAANEVDNLEFVSSVDGSGGPCVAADDGSVVFNGDAVAFEFKRGDEVSDGGGLGERWKFALAAVDDEMHVLNVSRCVGVQSCSSGTISKT